MFMQPSPTAKNFRDARAHLTQACHATHATIILDRHSPVAILVPLDTVGLYSPGPKDRKLAAARKLFNAALEHLRTQ